MKKNYCKHWTLLIMLCLLLGAVTTVGVAWGLMHFPFLSLDQMGEVPGLGPARFIESHSGSGIEVWFSHSYLRVRPPQMTSEDFPEWFTPSGTNDTVAIKTGLPFASFTAQFEGPAGTSYHDGDSYLDDMLANPHTPAFVAPQRVIVTGFVLDCVLFGTLWLGCWLTYRAIRRLNRRIFGLCPMCKYNLRGELENGCPECGWNRES